MKINSEKVEEFFSRPIVFVIAMVCLAILMTELMLLLPAKAQAEEITFCTKKSGATYRIGPEFNRQECRPKHSLLVMNSEGPQGIPGEQGEPGEPGMDGEDGLPGEDGLDAFHGAGNIAFIALFSSTTYALGVDGRVWILYSGNIPYSQITTPLGTLPVSVEEVVSWELFSLIDIYGNLWYINPGGVQNGWMNFGPVP